jgi:hypothetical protein
MTPWQFHEQFSTVDVNGVHGFPNHYSPNWLNDLPRYDGDPSLAIPHIENFLRYISEINVTHEDVMMRLFLYSFGMKQKDWVRHYGGPKSVTFMALFFEIFLEHWVRPLQDYKSALNNILENRDDEVLKLLKLRKHQLRLIKIKNIKGTWMKYPLMIILKMVCPQKKKG